MSFDFFERTVLFDLRKKSLIRNFITFNINKRRMILDSFTKKKKYIYYNYILTSKDKKKTFRINIKYKISLKGYNKNMK